MPCIPHETPPRTRRPALLAVFFFVLALVAARPAWADSAESQARALQKKAMEEDYLTVDFDKALDKLNKAIAKCGEKCPTPLRATLHRDVATVQSAAGKKDEALAAMTEALKIDAAVQLDANFKTKELEAIYAAAKKAGGGGGGGGGGGAGGGGGGGGGAAPAGDFTHTPAGEQAQRTPIPVYVEYGGSETIAKVILKYKAYGMTEFKTLEMKKMGVGWGVLIPCLDSILGETHYYIQGFNEQNDPVATGGDRNNPYKVTIKRSITGVPPHLPGQSPPAACADTGDCPPDFPGCNKTPTDKPAGGGEEVTTKGEGEDCIEDAQCTSGSCKEEKCTAPAEGAAKGGPVGKRKKLWIGLDLFADIDFLPTAQDVCLLASSGPATPTNTAGYYCTDPGNNNSNYPARVYDGDGEGIQNRQIIPGKDDTVHGGGALGNIRIAVSADYAATDNILVGARVGFVLNTYPGSAAGQDGVGLHVPLHLEARGTYVFGKDALATPGVKFYAYVAGGVGEVDAPVTVTVALAQAAAPTGSQTLGGFPAGTKTVTAWEIGGPGFGALGAGVRIGVGGGDGPPKFAIVGGLRLTGAIGNGFLLGFAPEIGGQFGF